MANHISTAQDEYKIAVTNSTHNLFKKAEEKNKKQLRPLSVIGANDFHCKMGLT